MVINIDKIQKEEGFNWYKAKHRVSKGDGFLYQRDADISIIYDGAKYSTYNVLETDIWNDFVNSKNAESFCDQYGLLGLCGWYYGLSYYHLSSQDNIVADNNSDAFYRRNHEDSFMEPQVDFEIDGPVLSGWTIEQPHSSILNSTYYQVETENLEKLIPPIDYIGEFNAELSRAREVNELLVNIQNETVSNELTKRVLNAWKALDTSRIISPEYKGLKGAGQLFSDIIKLATLGIQPYLGPSRVWKYNYLPGPPSLLPFIYLNLSMSLARGSIPKLCASKTCSNVFIEDRPNKIFCGSSCKNAEKQRKYRLRQKEVKKIGKRSGGKKT